VDEHRIQLEKLETLVEKELTGRDGEPRRGGNVERGCTAATAEHRRCAQSEDRFLDALGRCRSIETTYDARDTRWPGQSSSVTHAPPRTSRRSRTQTSSPA
jgi:hypothetical protein